MSDLKVIKRNGEVVEFDSNRIKNAITKAFIATRKEATPELIDEIVSEISSEIDRRFQEFYPNVENIQDIVEKHLMQREFFDVVKSYILYRDKRAKQREEEKQKIMEKSLLGKLKVKKRNGSIVLFDVKKLRENILRASKGFESTVSVDLIAKETAKNVYDGVTTKEIERALVLASISFIEKDPAYNFVSAKLFLQKLFKEVFEKSTTPEIFDSTYREAFIRGIESGVKEKLFDERMLEFDLNRLSQELKTERDNLFGYMGIQTLFERYFSRIKEKRIETPQAFWMRVSMGLALNEENKNERAIEFYELVSSLRFVPSTPTLFHSGTRRPQLSSCYLTTVSDDLSHIFKCIGDNAQLSKWSGGLGNDWTSIRATGAWIKSTNVESQGVIPFLKIANDVTAAINRSGKRRGATCAYLETWHLDIEDFLDLRKNTGDDRRRTHDMNTANWVPDLFMKRMLTNKDWTLFSPDEVPELHDLFGRSFEKKYAEYEEKTRKGEIKKFKTIPAAGLWRKMLSRLFETGHPWITFKDACNVRSPQDHAGIIHSSNLCTEITLNTSADETAVCNLGSVNLEKHVSDNKLDQELLANTVKTAVRMLDNVIDINYYPTIEAKNSNFRHRPIGLGIMGFQDALFKLEIIFSSPAATEFADTSQEIIAFNAILASSTLAKERGKYESYNGSKWDKGIFPQDTIQLLEEERGMPIEVKKQERLDWTPVREHVKQFGMRNSNTMAIAPTATISNIAGCYPCIEPIYKNIYVKANMSGEFTVVNPYLVEDFKKAGQWNSEMLEQLKYHDGKLELIAGIPDEIKERHKEAFEIDPEHCINISAARGKWIDQSQSHNVFMQGVSGKKLNDIYVKAWKTGLKTTYYLRTMAKSQIEKSTLDASKYGFTQKREYLTGETTKQENLIKTTIQAQNNHQTETKIQTVTELTENIKQCRIDDPDCEACQ